VRSGFLQGRTWTQGNFRAKFSLRLGHARSDAQVDGFFIDRENFFERRFAFDNGERAPLQFRFGAKSSRDGKIRNVDAGKRHGSESLSNLAIW